MKEIISEDIGTKVDQLLKRYNESNFFHFSACEMEDAFKIINEYLETICRKLNFEELI